MGDRLIRNVAKRLSGIVREQDMVCENAAPAKNSVREKIAMKPFNVFIVLEEQT